MPPKRHLYKVILLGNVGVGKSSMFRRLRDGAAYRHLPIHSTRASANGLDKHTKAFRMSNGESVFVSTANFTTFLVLVASLLAAGVMQLLRSALGIDKELTDRL